VSPAGGFPFELALIAAGAFLLLELALAVALAALAALSPVALRRMSHEARGRLAFLAELQAPDSAHRTAADLARQLCQGAVMLLALAAALERGSGAAAGVAVGLAALAVTAVLELGLARTLAVANPRRALGWTLWVLAPARLLLYPVVRPLHLMLARVARDEAPGDEARDEEQDEEVEALIEVGEREGLLEASESRMMRGIVDLDATHVREIMIPRTDVVALPAEASVDEARQLFLQCGHSRLPVYRETIDEIVGVLQVRDLLRAWDGAGASAGIAAYLRPAMFVPETRSVADLLTEMRLTSHLALVLDEYGGIAGLVTLEDVLEEIVGEIREEHDPEEPAVREVGDGSWIIDAATHVEELEHRFGVTFPERDFDTVGGLVVSELGRVPLEGEVLVVQGLHIEVAKAERRRIRQVRVRGPAVPPVRP